MQIDIRTNFPQVSAALARMRNDIASQAMARALNRTVEIARTDMSREIRKEYVLSASYVRDRLRISKATAGLSGLRLRAELIGGNGAKRAANVIAFSARQTRTGVTVKIKRNEGRKTITSAFIGNKGRTVFTRVGKSRLPIKPVQTIDVAQMFNTRRINARVVASIESKFPAIFAREASYYLQRAGL